MRIADGMCDAEPIRADVLEGAAFSLLEKFVGGLGEWVDQRVAARQRERAELEVAADRERSQLRKLERRAERAQDIYDAALDDDNDQATDALEQVSRIRGDLDRQATVLADAEAMVAEWSADVDTDALKLWLADLFAAIDGRMKESDAADDVAAAFRSNVATLSAIVVYDEKGRRLQVEMVTRIAGEARVVEATRSEWRTLDSQNARIAGESSLGVRLKQPADWRYLDSQDEVVAKRLLDVLGAPNRCPTPSCTTSP